MLSPPELRRRLGEEAQKILENYGGPTSELRQQPSCCLFVVLGLSSLGGWFYSWGKPSRDFFSLPLAVRQGKAPTAVTFFVPEHR